VNVIHGLAATLNSALSSGSAKVELEAYGGPRGDKSSDSRRLSLKRALVVRELLIEDGIPSEKIDVRAMGGADSARLIALTSSCAPRPVSPSDRSRAPRGQAP